MERTIACPICRAPYKIYANTVADQTARPACVAEADRRSTAPSDWERAQQAARRQRHFDRGGH